MTVLAPDLRDAFGVSDGAIVFISSASAAFFVLGAVPMGYLADRYRRARIVGFSSLMFSVMVFLSGLAVSAFMLFWTRFGAGIAKANTLPVHGSLLADTYPISLRGRIAAAISMVGRSRPGDQPAARGRARDRCSDGDGRSSCSVCPSPCSACWRSASASHPRGQWEKHGVLDEVIEDADAAPISMEAAFARLMRIRTLRTVVIGFAALGFSLFTVPVLASLFMEDEFGLERASNAASSPRSPGSSGIAHPAVARAALRSVVPPRSERVAAHDRPVHRADGDRLAAAVPDARADARSPSLEVIRSLLAVAAFSMVTPLIQHVVAVPACAVSASR